MAGRFVLVGSDKRAQTAHAFLPPVFRRRGCVPTTTGIKKPAQQR